MLTLYRYGFKLAYLKTRLSYVLRILLTIETTRIDLFPKSEKDRNHTFNCRLNQGKILGYQR